MLQFSRDGLELANVYLRAAQHSRDDAADFAAFFGGKLDGVFFAVKEPP